MANSLSFSSVCSFNTCNKPGIIIDNSFPRKVLVINEVFKSSRSARMCSLEAKAAEKNQSTKPTSIVCADCEGNGAKQCSQCKGTGVNSVDHFNGQFKAGGLCWLCRGKREILCGNCNGAGFTGGFMSTLDD
ncbi:hypothetical protein ES332_D06G070200v1 [Gossypium tomentosum]|uniref:BSD2 cysteine rich domain-containing protein n=1 Tax=Gossypium tomentosum TaxID=34277 RepID=A0A5D2KFU3_GOSTO|nr:hypothetical protein ES332_D06G070200v1 [Gossypium tomentosum]